MQTALYILLAFLACLALVALVLWWDLRKYPTITNDMPE